MKKMIVIPLALFCCLAYAQPQRIFMTDLSVLEFSHSKELKGRFISEDEGGTAYYVCNKPLLGFTTMLMQKNGMGKPLIRAMANDQAPLPPMLEKILDQYTRSAEILGITKKDSETDAGLKEYMKKLPKIRRIIAFTKQGESRAVVFYQNLDWEYFIDITLND